MLAYVCVYVLGIEVFEIVCSLPGVVCGGGSFAGLTL